MDPRYADAIAAIESSGDYGLLGPPTNGDRAYGKYQVMGNNIGPWTKDAMGRSMSPDEFLKSPEAQDAVFNHRFGSYVDKYGNANDAASAWFTGRPQAQGADAKDILGTSGSEYVRRFNAALGNPTETKRAKMDPGALSASGLTGDLGALFGGGNANRDTGLIPSLIQNGLGGVLGDRENFGRSMLWLKSIEHPELAAAAAAPKDNFTMMATPDGGIIGYNKKTGKYGQVMAPTPKVEKIGSGPMGDIMGIRVGSKYIDPQTGQVLMDAGAASRGALPGADQGVPSAGPSLIPRQYLAQGVNQFDDALQGPDRVAQFHPTIAADINDMYNGEKMPVGKGDKYTQFIRREAAALAAAKGESFSDTTFGAKRAALNDLAKSSPASAGGQAILALTALNHLGEVKGSYDTLGNKAPLDYPVLNNIPGTGNINRGINAIGNTTAANAGAVNGLKDAVTRYSEESSKYYAGSQAAQAERERIHNLYGENLTPAESNTALRTERNLMRDKIEEAIGQLSSTLGSSHPRIQELKQRLDQTLAKVDKQLGITSPSGGLKLPPGVKSIQLVQ